MCIIIAAPPTHKIDRDVLEDAIFENPDGAGYMFAYRGELVMDRSANDMDRMVAQFLAFQDAHPECWGVFHARIATQGQCVDENTHPFLVPGKPWGLVHNGVMPLSDGPWGDRSDSRILAEDHVSQKSWADILASRGQVEKWLRNNKVVILSAHRERGGRCIILNESKGHLANGVWLSHHQTHARTRKSYVSNAYQTGQWQGNKNVDRSNTGTLVPVKGGRNVTKRFLRIQEAADLLNVSVNDVQGWAGYVVKDVDALVDEILGAGLEPVIEPEPKVREIAGKWNRKTGIYEASDGTYWQQDPNDPKLIVEVGSLDGTWAG